MTPVDHFLGRTFELGRQDCYTLMRDFYAEVFGIVLPNFARPENFWELGMDLYVQRAAKTGFQTITCHPSEYQLGDVVLMAINSTHANHAGILLEDGRLLHHLFGRLSTVEPYRGFYKHLTVGLFRHKAVVIEQSSSTTDIDPYLTPKAREHLARLRSAAAAPE